MGHSTIFDIIGSILTFGVLLLITLRLNASASEYSSAYSSNSILQKNMIALTVMLEDDLKHVGSNWFPPPGGGSPIILADTDRFSFQVGNLATSSNDRIDYIVGPTSELASTSNPNDRYLYRNVNGIVNRMNLGLTTLRFRYWFIGDPTSPLATPVNPTGNIGPVDVMIRLESPYRMKQEYMDDTTQYEMLWRQMRSVARTTQVQSPL
jgi:hypothetical protein